ncbi:MAG: hypothetical protein KDH96_00180 [Candidatus Riesia sp.]|nr:hypothetical protein [Candidatus Riesia sp.]
MPYSKIYKLNDYNVLVEHGIIKKDFDYKELHKESYKSTKRVNGDFTIIMDMIPIECPDCESKLYKIAIDSLKYVKNINGFFDDTDDYVRCLTCGFKGFRKVPNG